MSPTPAKLSRWSVSAIVVLVIHAGLFYWAFFWQPVMNVPELPPAAMVIELAPLPPAAPKPAPPPPPEVRPEEPEPMPKLVEAPKPTITITKPKPKPKPQPKPPKPKPPEPTPPEPDHAPDDAPTAPEAPQISEAPAAPQMSAPSISSAEQNWQSELAAHFKKAMRYPEDARRRGIEGVNRVLLVVDEKGYVVSFEMVSKSVSNSLDRATMQMIRRAQPLPPPPKELLQGGTKSVNAPFVYTLTKGRR